MKNFISPLWWQAASKRAARTALVVVLPYLPASYLGDVPYVTIGLVAALAVVTSLLTSSVSALNEIDDTPSQAWWYAVLNRVGKTVGQALLAGMGTAVLITDVPWDNIWQMAVTAGFGSLILALITVLPESEIPLAKPALSTLNTVVIQEGGSAVVNTAEAPETDDVSVQAQQLP